MKRMELMQQLATLDREGVCVFTKGDFEKMFPEEQEKAFEKSLQRMVADGILVRACKGIYVNPLARSKDGRVVEKIAQALRTGFFSYVSLESMLSEYGVISQVPIDRITIMTTGARGTYATPFGIIEFTHTKRRPAEIIKRTLIMPGRPLRVATKLAAAQDLARAGRNTNMMIAAELSDLDLGDDDGQEGLQPAGRLGDDAAGTGVDAPSGGKGDSPLRHFPRP